jgi:N-methylhydantoinase A
MTTLDHQFVSLRAIGMSNPMTAHAEEIPTGDGSALTARIGDSRAYIERAWCQPSIYGPIELRAGDRIAGPAIIEEMDATTVILAAPHRDDRPTGQHHHQPGP